VSELLEPRRVADASEDEDEEEAQEEDGDDDRADAEEDEEDAQHEDEPGSERKASHRSSLFAPIRKLVSDGISNNARSASAFAFVLKVKRAVSE
jgi:hypothetical protein